MITILKYDVDMLNHEITKLDENVTRVKKGFQNLTIKKTKLLKEAHKIDWQKIKNINNDLELFKDEIKKMKDYKNRLIKYVKMIKKHKEDVMDGDFA